MELSSENKKHIDSMSYESLLAQWRHAPSGNPWFQGETGKYWGARMAELRAKPGGQTTPNRNRAMTEQNAGVGGRVDPLVGPRRIQRRRTKGWKMPPNTVYVGRPTKWGNSFAVSDYGREHAVAKFREYIGHPNSPHGFEPEDIEELRGMNLACWCREDQTCHADVLLALANA